MKSEWLKDFILANGSRNGYNFPADAFTWPVFNYDDVQRFFYSGNDQEHWNIETDFPYIRPPFQSMFMEAGRIDTITSEGKTISLDASNRLDRICIVVLLDRPRPEMTNATSSLNFVVFVEALGKIVNAGSYIVGLSSDGAPALTRDEKGEIAECFGMTPSRDEDTARSRRAFVRLCVEPAMLALTFLNCKDTTIREDVPLRAIRRRMEKEGKPQSKYYVLDIKPLRNAVQSRQAHSGETLSKALHYCRGHFAVYTEENPLFGKHTGRYWRQPHLRGKVEAGVVVKDYKIGEHELGRR